MKHVLVTNDDGIDSGFLKALVEGLKTQFKVTIAAPRCEQSWIGRAISRRTDVHWERSDLFPGCDAYAIDGTPSDCVNIALGHFLTTPPDLVCSGINIGFNATLSLIFSSGTVAGALEGAFWGLPALAFSHQIAKHEFAQVATQRGHVVGPLQASLQAAGRIATDLALDTMQQTTDGPIVHNVNFPCHTTMDTPQEITQLAPTRLTSLFAKKAEDRFAFRYSEIESNLPYDCDYACLQRGHISKTTLDVSQVSRG